MPCIFSAPLLFSSDRIKTCFHTLETFYPLSGTQSYASCVCTGHCRAALLIGQGWWFWVGVLCQWLVYRGNEEVVWLGSCTHSILAGQLGLLSICGQGKLWGVRGRSGSSRHRLRTAGRVSICILVRNSSQIGGVWRQTLRHAGSGDICHVWVTYLRNQ